MKRLSTTFLIVLVFSLVFSSILANPKWLKTASATPVTVNKSFYFDASGQDHRVKSNGGAVIDPAQYVFGTSGKAAASGSFDGASSISMKASTSFLFGSTDFTIELWAKRNSGRGVYFGQYGNASNYWLFIDNWFYWVETVPLASYVYAIPTTAWHHIAAVRNGANFYIFIDGVSLTLTINTAIGTNVLHYMKAPLIIGYETSTGLYHNGFHDESRISNTARWTSNFTPPTSPYSTDANTKLLLHYDDYYVGQWNGIAGTIQTPDSTPYFWSSVDSTFANAFSSVAVIGQRQISVSGNTWAVLFCPNGFNDLWIGVARFSGAFAGLSSEVRIWTSITEWNSTKGAVISDLVCNPTDPSWFYCVVAGAKPDGGSAALQGIQFAVVKIDNPTTEVSRQTVTVVGTYSHTYSNAGLLSSQYASVIHDCQLFPTATGTAYMSYSYVSSAGLWYFENVQLSNIFGAPGAIVCGVPNDYTGVGWNIPVAFKFAYSYYNSKIYAVSSGVYIQTYDDSHAVTLYDVTTMTAPSSVAAIKYSASPSTIVYDQKRQQIYVSFFTSAKDFTPQVEFWRWSLALATGYESHFLDPISGGITDCRDFTMSINNCGQIFIAGLFFYGTNAYTMFKYSTDFGVNFNPSSGGAWYKARSGFYGQLSQMISMSTQMQGAGFQIGEEGRGILFEYDGTKIYLMNFQYQSNIITFSGTYTLTGFTTSTVVSSIQQISATTLAGVKSTTFTTVTYLSSDAPTTTIMFSVLVFMTCIGVTVLLQRSILAMIIGLMLGITINTALGLVPMWILIVVLIALVAALVFSSRRD